MQEEKDKAEEVGDIYFAQSGRVRYLISKNNKKGCCQVCGKRRKTTAHHIIPKRLKCFCPILAEVRIRVCKECDEDFHPENKLLRESEIICRQNKNINNLKDAVYWRSMKLNKAIQTIDKTRRMADEFLDSEDEEFYRKGKKVVEFKEDERR